MSKYIYRVSIKLLFEQGVCPGAGSESNVITITRNGDGAPVLRGSSIAGVIRSEINKKPSEMAEVWFGKKNDKDSFNTVASRIRIDDCILDTGVNKETVITRTHNAINRHTGAAIKNGLFSIESLPPGTTGVVHLEIDARNEDEIKNENKAMVVLQMIADIVASGVYFGGNKSRGIGLLTSKEIAVRKFDVSLEDQYAALLNEKYEPGIMNESAISTEIIKGKSIDNNFYLKLILGIPRGEDLLVGDGQTFDFVLEPQKVRNAEGKEYWRIPGSTFRGIFRAWMTRLAAREPVTEEIKILYKSVKEINRDVISIKNDDIANAFVVDSKEQKKYQEKPEELKDPIYSLFGSSYCKGRIEIHDSISKSIISENDTQERTHVAIDKFTGGTIDGALYTNKVLTNKEIEFPLVIKIKNATENELKWLLKTLKVLHLGILTVGSSKSAGHLEIKTITFCSDNTFQNNLLIFLKEHGING